MVCSQEIFNVENETDFPLCSCISIYLSIYLFGLKNVNFLWIFYFFPQMYVYYKYTYILGDSFIAYM
jgi:hypothetical protein